mgnify:FL=1
MTILDNAEVLLYYTTDKQNLSIGIFQIILAVQLESFLWGLGTAIGELPPYFIAKKVNKNVKRLLKRGHNCEK